MKTSEISEIIKISERTLNNWKNDDKKKTLYKFIVENVKEENVNEKDYIKNEMIKAINKLPPTKAKKFYYLMMAELTEMGH